MVIPTDLLQELDVKDENEGGRLLSSGGGGDRGKVMSQEANKLQKAFLANSIYSRDPISKMSINCRSPFWPIQSYHSPHPQP
jgi:hypothetical protein